MNLKSAIFVSLAFVATIATAAADGSLFDPSKSVAQGPGKERAYTGETATFTYVCKDTNNDPMGSAPVPTPIFDVYLVGPEVVPVTVAQSVGANFPMSYVASIPGDYLLYVRANGVDATGSPVGSPYPLHVYPTYRSCAISQNMHHADLSFCDFGGQDLSGVNLNHADLQWANLEGANLSGANLNHADLSGACADGADFAGANLNFANASNADFTSANLAGANTNDIIDLDSASSDACR